MSAARPAGPATAGSGLYLVKGDDASLVDQEVHRLVGRLVGEDDPSLVVEEFGGPSAEGLDVGAVIDACTTPSLLVPKRVVVVRDAGQLNAADVKRLSPVLDDPLPSTTLVLVAGGGAVPPALVKRISASGTVVDTAVGRGKARSQWLSDHLKGAPVRFDGPAVALLSDHLGDQMGRLDGLLGALAAAYGPGATVSLVQLEPFLGVAGSAPPWDLTDALDGGDTAAALAVLRRMVGAGGSHPLVVMGGLHRHYRQMLRLDGSGVATAAEAAAALGLRSEFPARKALAQARRLGSSGIARAIRLLAAADLDLRGATALPGEVVLEVLVARLSRVAPRVRR